MTSIRSYKFCDSIRTDSDFVFKELLGIGARTGEKLAWTVMVEGDIRKIIYISISLLILDFLE